MESLCSWGRRGVRACVRAAPSQARAVQCTPANFPAASTPAGVSAALQTTSAHPQPLLLPGRCRSPEFQVRISTHSPATADLSLRDQCSFRSPRRLLRTTCAPLHRLGGPWVGCDYTAQHLSDALKVHPMPHPSAYLARVLTVLPWFCGLVHTFCNLVISERKSCYNPEATWLLALSPFLFQSFFFFNLNFCFLAFRTILGPKDRWPGTPSRRSWQRGAWP